MVIIILTIKFSFPIIFCLFSITVHIFLQHGAQLQNSSKRCPWLKDTENKSNQCTLGWIGRGLWWWKWGIRWDDSGTWGRGDAPWFVPCWRCVVPRVLEHASRWWEVEDDGRSLRPRMKFRSRMWDVGGLRGLAVASVGEKKILPCGYRLIKWTASSLFLQSLAWVFSTV